MGVLLAGGATWLILLVLVLSLCRAALGAAPAEAAAPCSDAEVPYDADPAAVRDALECEIARTRARHDRDPLRRDRRLARAADRHAADMVQRRYFGHVSPGGGELRDRLQRSGYAFTHCHWRAGEVLAWGLRGRSSARGIVRAWMRSPDHRRVIVSDRYAELGLGFQAGTPERHRSGVTVAAVLGYRDCSP